MADLYWPGDERAGDIFGAGAFLDAMVRIEQTWLAALVAAKIAPADAAATLPAVTGDAADAVAAGAEGGGNPVLDLLAVLREQLRGEGNEAGATWLHRGLTSQDVVDTALVLCSGEALDRIGADLTTIADHLGDLADAHRGTVMVGRTLTQYAVPITFGLKAAFWRAGILDAIEEVDRVRARLTLQAGGAAGTLAALVELADGDLDVAAGVVADTARDLGLRAGVPWHTTRTPITRIGDALATATQACGRIASDVLTLARPEIAELAEPSGAGRGGSSTMPQKRNPVLSVLIRRAALTTPNLAATLHTAAALADDERPDGAWHAEWPTLRDLARRTVVAASQTAEVVSGLVVDGTTMARRATEADGLLAERASMRRLLGRETAAGDADDPRTYLGLTDSFIDAVARRSGPDRTGVPTDAPRSAR